MGTAGLFQVSEAWTRAGKAVLNTVSSLEIKKQLTKLCDLCRERPECLKRELCNKVARSPFLRFCFQKQSRRNEVYSTYISWFSLNCAAVSKPPTFHWLTVTNIYFLLMSISTVVNVTALCNFGIQVENTSYSHSRRKGNHTLMGLQVSSWMWHSPIQLTFQRQSMAKFNVFGT